MADSRINLLSSASSTASDDFFVVDGTTNGTRKLNAFSPTIGGNLAVTGTLTVGSTGTVSGNLLVNSSTAQVIIGQASASQLTYLIRPAQAGGAIQIVQDAMTVNRWLSLGGCDNTGVFVEGLRVGPNIQIPGTTASTSTSSGALVVGNGTSGGLGVGGAINAGGQITGSGGLKCNRPAICPIDLAPSDDSVFWRIAWESNAYNPASNRALYIAYNGSTTALQCETSGVVKIPNTSSSTTTSSGALVVGNGTSGGLGVGGAINAGGLILSSGSTAGLGAESRDGSGYRATWYNPTGDDMQLDFAGIGTKFTITSAGNTTIAGTLTANGTTGTFGSSTSSGTSLKVISGVGTLAAPKYSTLDFRTYNDSGTGAYIRTGNRQSDTNEWLLEIAARSNADVLTSVATFGASGTTFAGPLTGGNVVKSANSAAANGTEFIALRAEVGADATLGPALVTIGALPSATGASRYGFIASYDSYDWRTLYLGGSPGVAANGGQVRVPANISSTSTSSGALVVSGGVGVAGNIWTGGQVNLAATSVEASTGINFGVALAASRDIVFFGDGTRGGMLRGYHDGSNIARLGFGYWASSGDTYTSVIDITGSATTSSQLVAIAGTAGSTSTTSGALTVAGGMGVAEAVNAGTFFGLVDGVTAPATGSGYARIYVDSADGDLKVKFGDGTVKTIATDS